MIYLVIYALIFILYLISAKVINKYATISLLILMVLFTGLRYRIGGDSIAYAFQFKEFSVNSNLSDLAYYLPRYNIGWILFNKLVSILRDFVYFQVIHSFLVLTSFYVLLKKLKVNIFAGFLLFFPYFYLLLTTEVLRESLAASIFWYFLAISAFKKINLFTTVLLIFLAYCFHTSALIAFSPFVVFRIYQKFISISRSVSGRALLKILAILIFVSILSIIYVFSENILSLLGFMYYFGISSDVSISGIAYYFVLSMPCIYFLSIKKNLSLTSYQIKSLSICSYIVVAIFVIRVLVFPYAERLMTYFCAPYIVIIIYSFDFLFYSLKNDFKRITKALFYFAFSFLFVAPSLLATTYYGSWPIYKYFPYSSIFNPFKYEKREQMYRVEAKEPTNYLGL